MKMNKKDKRINGNLKCTDKALESVRLIVTLKSRWQLTDYRSQSQIGYTEVYEEYIQNPDLNRKEHHRVLNKSCSVYDRSKTKVDYNVKNQEHLQLMLKLC